MKGPDPRQNRWVENHPFSDFPPFLWVPTGLPTTPVSVAPSP